MSAYWHYLAEATISTPLRLRGALRTDAGTYLPAGAEPGTDFIEQCADSFEAERIEALFVLDVPYDADLLERELIAYLSENLSFSELYQEIKHRYWLKLGADLLLTYPSIGFRLAIMRACLPFEYKRTLFCLWMAVFESEFSEREQASFEMLFLSALSHDLGLLDVNPHFTRLDHDPRSSKDDKDGYYSHVYYGVSFLERVGSVPSAVLRSIKQHHEILDGTGYPAGASGTQLTEFSQHINLYDTLYSIFQKNYRPLSKRLADLKPVIEINAVTHFGAVAVRMLELLTQASRSDEVFFKREEFERIQTETEHMAMFIERAMAIIQDFTSTVGYRHDDKSMFVLQNSFIHISLAYYKLRILHKQARLDDAMHADGNYRQLSRVLEDNFLALREIIFHINKFLYRLRLYRSSVDQETIRIAAEAAIDKLSALAVKLVR
ncbi:HD domain-containing phosphohydrolase [Agaribacterium haliotis]|uniref:HD domain-containing phosphohydrolase n=1 Tax=Agaribacterium haliotis TaxID=2013869 RepID=UPI000BB550C3|nr:HD domain-containing phosphohydrolase [Agaribacterium haliotis]